MIDENKILEIISQWSNYWKKEFIDRELTETILKNIGKEVIDIIGVRRGGKSTLLALIIKKLQLDEKKVLYVNFEEPAFVNYYSTELLDKILEVYKLNINPDAKPYLFLDEIQLIPQWEKWVRKIRDLELAHVFVTGSSSQLMSKEYGTALTGRHITHTLHPLSFKEYMTFKNEKPPANNAQAISSKIIIKKLLSQYLITGGFPEVTLTNNKELLKNYFEDIIYKDIILRHEIRDAKTIRELAIYCLTNMATLTTYNALRKYFKLSMDAIRNYLSYMEEAFLIFQVPLFSYSLKVQELNPRKIHCIDNGLRNAVSFTFSKDEGRLAENAVFLELKRRGKNIYYWNNVDFVTKEPLTGINVTYTDEIDERELKGLKEFGKKYKTRDLLLITKDTETEREGVKLVPLWKWLLNLEHNPVRK